MNQAGTRPTSQALDWIKAHLFEPAIITYYRELVLSDWRKGYTNWYALSPESQKYIIEHDLKGPRSG